LVTQTNYTSSTDRDGVEIAQPLGDRPYGLRDYTVRDLHGYRLTFGHRLAYDLHSNAPQASNFR